MQLSLSDSLLSNPKIACMKRKPTIIFPENIVDPSAQAYERLGSELSKVLMNFRSAGLSSQLLLKTPESYCGIARGMSTDLPVEKDRV